MRPDERMVVKDPTTDTKSMLCKNKEMLMLWSSMQQLHPGQEMMLWASDGREGDREAQCSCGNIE